jgi:hypothetical protein
MNKFARLALPSRLALPLCLALTAAANPRSGFAATIDEQISARLAALEKENADLRARVNQLEASKAAKIKRRPAVLAPNPAYASTPRPQYADRLTADAGQVTGRVGGQVTDHLVDQVVGKAAATRTSYAPPRFELSGSLLFLQPGAGNLEYGTLVSPFPIATPNWNNQSLAPGFSPAFRFGARYMANESNDIQLNWTHLNTTTNGSFSAGPTQMVGPPYLIGPESALYKIANGDVQFAYDSVNFDGGHTFCVECSFQLRVFGGVEVARIGQNLTGTFQSLDGSASSAYTTTSLFTGTGPRLGLKGQYALGDFQFIGEFAGAGLIGTSQSRINFSTTSPTLVGNNQSLTSPNATQVIPSIDARLATAYTFPPSNSGQFRIEAGWQAAVYFDAVSQYSLTQVPTSLMLPPTGVFLATAQHLQSNFTDQGPYLTVGWLF